MHDLSQTSDVRMPGSGGSGPSLNRMSISLPNADTFVSCIPTCVRPGESPRYEPVVASEWILARVRESQPYLPPEEAGAASLPHVCSRRAVSARIPCVVHGYQGIGRRVRTWLSPPSEWSHLRRCEWAGREAVFVRPDRSRFAQGSCGSNARVIPASPRARFADHPEEAGRRVNNSQW